MNAIQSPLRVVIVGGGFTGASLAWQLAGMTLPARITVVEPRAELGRGLAYSATDPTHRINVPAHRMSIDPDNRADFAEWIAEDAARLDPQAVAPSGDLYPQRALFGRYVSERLAPHLESGAIRHIRARVSDVERSADGALVLLLSDETRIRADLLVLATGHPAPAVPKVVAGLTGSAVLVPDPGDAVRLADIPEDARVLILGAALSAADVIATLDRQGHRGQITCLSRRGLRSRAQGPVCQDSGTDFTDPPATKASDLLRRVRDAIVDDQARGQGWHATFYRLRAQGPQIWAALDMDARARLLRHLRTWWDVHRYRLAPQVEAVIARLLDEGRLDYAAGHLVAAERRDGGADVTWRPRGTDTLRRERFDRIVVTTGPAQDRCIGANPALAALARLGLIAPCPLGLGLATTAICKAQDAQGRTSDRILIAGPLARGHVGELVGAPECAAHARHIAREIARRVMLAPILRPAFGQQARGARPT
ncbi:FAD/NAD(P)-binding protein [Paracoccus yeei]|uniref:FAD/NAD(P)-binding protein n=1 Tax=Paracoccus yeei TaxID=147645 RepID=UPI000688ED8B|nr:FAD-dependent oxidoreductase [Paracoccus yeei]OWJ94472.1 hydroxyacylglutathione hydrolase [Paracoccus yeei]